MVARLKGRPGPSDPATETEQSGTKKAKKQSPLLMGLTVISVLVAIAASSTLVYTQYFAHPSSGKAHDSASQGVGHSTTTTGPMFAMGPFVVNLGEVNERRYARIALSLDFETQDAGFVGQNKSTQKSWREHMKEELKAHEPILKDVVLTTLSSQNVQSLSSTMGKETLKADLIAQFNQHMPEGLHVQRVYFTDFVIQ